MTERKFTVIKGGVDLNAVKFSSRRFISAFVTDTRLMGVVGMGIHWEIPEGNTFQYLDQFFYYDAEEYGLETYTGLRDADAETLALTEQTLMGGLGGQKVDLTEAETRFLLQNFAAGSERLGVSLPQPRSEYEFMLREPLLLSESGKQAAFDKMCSPLRSNYELIHYFLMRCLGKDSEGADYLMKTGFFAAPGDLLTDAPAASAARRRHDSGGADCITALGFDSPVTLCQNTINEYVEEDGSVSYLCEALAELDESYSLMVLEVTVHRKQILSAALRSKFQVSAAEAAMMLNRSEYVTIYEILTDPDSFDGVFLPLTPGMLQTSHSNGRLFLEFNRNNDHVNQQVFRLNEDVHGLFFVSDYGQFLAAAYDLRSIHEMESWIHKQPLGALTIPTARFEFKEPVLYEFIESEYDEFEEFLDSLQPEDDE